MTKISKNLVNARCRMLAKMPWYGFIVSRFKWVRNDSVNTMGVRIIRRGLVECIYNLEFVESLSLPELIAVLRHEVEHIIRMHLARVRYIKDENHNKLWNIACDWTINGVKNQRNIDDLPDMACYVPASGDVGWDDCDLTELEELGTAEEYYDWLLKNIKIIKVGGNGNGDGDSGGIDNHEVWSQSSASKEDMRCTAKDLTRQATQNVGSTPGHLVDSISKLDRPTQNWLFRLKNIIGRVAGNKRRTYAKWHRRRDSFGVKGISRRASIPITVCTDTSGSVSKKMLERIFTEIEAMSSYFRITLVQFDHEVQSVTKYHKGDWRSIEIKGRGGTSFDSLLEYLEKEKIINKMTFILSDGYCSVPSPRPYPVTWVIWGEGGKQYMNSQGMWGELVYIEHDYDYD